MNFIISLFTSIKLYANCSSSSHWWERSWTAHTKNCFINIFPVLLMSATKVLAHGLRHAGCRVADPNQIEPSGWERRREKNWMILNIFYIHLIGAWKNEKKLIFQIFIVYYVCGSSVALKSVDSWILLVWWTHSISQSYVLLDFWEETHFTIRSEREFLINSIIKRPPMSQHKCTHTFFFRVITDFKLTNSRCSGSDWNDKVKRDLKKFVENMFSLIPVIF